MAGDICLFISALVVCELWLIVLRDRLHHHHADTSSAMATRQRLLKPRTPDDCQECRHVALSPSASPSPPFVGPWRELKSRRGAPRRIPTDGFAYPKPLCWLQASSA